MSPERWSSRAGFIFAAMGSAIGLGSIWKFPYEVGANGGGGFLVFYLLGLGVIVFPLLLLEFAIGRQGGHALGQERQEATGRAVEEPDLDVVEAEEVLLAADLSRARAPDERGLLALIAARLGRTRLIDNLEFDAA